MQSRMPDSKTEHPASATVLRVSVVIPVYRGAKTLPVVCEELAALSAEQASPAGQHFVVDEVLLVHDCGPDRSDLCIESLAETYPFIRPVWLTRNYGQHAATLAGMASATGDWVVTIDEDGQQDPADIGRMLDTALEDKLQLVYAKPLNPPPHGWLRNTFSRIAKSVTGRLLGNRIIGQFNSFRCIDAEIARTLAAYCGNGVYLDMGLYWITGRIGHCPVHLREELGRPSAYGYWKLLGHFWNLLFTTGTRPLRLITLVGFFSVLLAIGVAGYALYAKLFGASATPGWASLVIVVAFFSGCILTALGIIAEYMVVTMGIVMGKPLYVISTKPTRPGP